MRNVRKILDLKKEMIPFSEQNPFSIELCKIKHSAVHYHTDTLEMVLCLKGSVSICCNHEWLELHEGEIYTIVERDIHCIWSDEENITAVIHIDTKGPSIAISKLQESYIACEDLTCQPFQVEPIRQVKAMLLALAYGKYFGTIDDAAATQATRKLVAILLDYFNWFGFRDNYPGKNPAQYDRMLRVIEYCEANYREKLTISKLAEEVHISENYFSQFFKHCPYGSFSLMVGYIRCYYAQELLLSAQLPIIEIAQQCGFSDVKYMYKSFRYWWKMSPDDYRQWFAAYVKAPDSIEYLDKKSAQDFIQSYAARIFSELLI